MFLVQIGRQAPGGETVYFSYEQLKRKLNAVALVIRNAVTTRLLLKLIPRAADTEKR